jgi:hypothetical protein
VNRACLVRKDFKDTWVIVDGLESVDIQDLMEVLVTVVSLGTVVFQEVESLDILDIVVWATVVILDTLATVEKAQVATADGLDFLGIADYLDIVATVDGQASLDLVALADSVDGLE